MAEEAGRRAASDEERELLEHLDEPNWFEDAEVTAQLRAMLEPLAAHYFLKARTREGTR